MRLAPQHHHGQACRQQHHDICCRNSEWMIPPDASSLAGHCMAGSSSASAGDGTCISYLGSALGIEQNIGRPGSTLSVQLTAWTCSVISSLSLRVPQLLQWQDLLTTSVAACRTWLSLSSRAQAGTHLMSRCRVELAWKKLSPRLMSSAMLQPLIRHQSRPSML